MVAIWIRCSVIVSAVLSVVAILLFFLTTQLLAGWLLSGSVQVAFSYNRFGPASKSSPQRLEAERIGCYLADEVEERHRGKVGGTQSKKLSQKPLPEAHAVAAELDLVTANVTASVTASVTDLDERIGGEDMSHELAGFVAQALLDHSGESSESPNRNQKVARALARHGLNVRVLRAASGQGTLSDLYAALRDVPELSAGERLSIATAAMKAARQSR